MRTFLKIFSIIIYLFLAYIFSARIKNLKEKKSAKKILFIYLLLIVVMSYFFNCYYEIDLTRLQERLMTFSKMTLDDFIKNVFTVTNYSEYTYFFLISRFNNPNLLQTITSLIFYSIVFYTMYDYYVRSEMSNISLGNTLFLFMLWAKRGTAVLRNIGAPTSFIDCLPNASAKADRHRHTAEH